MKLYSKWVTKLTLKMTHLCFGSTFIPLWCAYPTPASLRENSENAPLETDIWQRDFELFIHESNHRNCKPRGEFCGEWESRSGQYIFTKQILADASRMARFSLFCHSFLGANIHTKKANNRHDLVAMSLEFRRYLVNNNKNFNIWIARHLVLSTWTVCIFTHI